MPDMDKLVKDHLTVAAEARAVMKEATAEILRLRAVNAELLAALKALVVVSDGYVEWKPVEQARAAIAKAEVR